MDGVYFLLAADMASFLATFPSVATEEAGYFFYIWVTGAHQSGFEPHTFTMGD